MRKPFAIRSFWSRQLNDQTGGPSFEDFAYKEAYAPSTIILLRTAPSFGEEAFTASWSARPPTVPWPLDCPDPANFTHKGSTPLPLQSLALYNNGFMLRQTLLSERIKRSWSQARKASGSGLSCLQPPA